MKTFRPTFVLIGLFFAGLLVLWSLEDSGVPTEAQRRGRLNRVLPDLIDVPETAVTRLEILRGGEALAFERKGTDRWQMTRPLDVAADSTIVETLIGNLKNLRKSPDSGTITAPPESYGLAPPGAVVRLWGDAGSEATSQPRLLAALEIGKTVRDQCFVRPVDTAGIEVVDKKLLGATSLPLTEWRQINLIPVPSFQISSLAIHRDALNLKADRGTGGRWHLSAPVKVPANGAKIESAIAALSSIRVLDGQKGFSADNVTDFAPFGLDRPEATIELTSALQPDSPLVLHVGKKVPDHPDRVYVRRGDQDDVVSVSDRFLVEIPRDSIAFRSQHVTDIDPAAVSEIAINTPSTTFRLERQGTAWRLNSPQAGKADSYLVQSLVNQLDGLQTSEFLDAARVIRPDLDPPLMTLKVWQSASNVPAPRAKRAESSEASAPTPALSLLIGRHDRLKKTIYGRLEGDSIVLALPDVLLDVLPRNRLAYRDRGVLSVNPATVTKLTLIREGTTTVLEPDRSSSAANQWRMVAPVRRQRTSGPSPSSWPCFPTSGPRTSQPTPWETARALASISPLSSSPGAPRPRRTRPPNPNLLRKKRPHPQARADACGSASPSPASRAHSTRRSMLNHSSSRSARRPCRPYWPSSTRPSCCHFRPTRSAAWSSACLGAHSPSSAARSPAVGRPTGSQSQEPEPTRAASTSPGSTTWSSSLQSCARPSFFSTMARFPPRRAWPGRD